MKRAEVPQNERHIILVNPLSRSLLLLFPLSRHALLQAPHHILFFFFLRVCVLIQRQKKKKQICTKANAYRALRDLISHSTLSLSLFSSRIAYGAAGHWGRTTNNSSLFSEKLAFFFSPQRQSRAHAGKKFTVAEDIFACGAENLFLSSLGLTRYEHWASKTSGISHGFTRPPAAAFARSAFICPLMGILVTQSERVWEL